MRLDLTGKYEGLHVEVDDEVSATTLVHMDAGVARGLIQRVYDAEDDLDRANAYIDFLKALIRDAGSQVSSLAND